MAAEAAAIGLDADAVATAVTQPEVKARLKAETDAAITRGVFGSPFIIVDDEPFWGADRLDHIAWYLQQGG